MPNATREQMKEEAIKRMKLLNLHTNAIHEFQDDGIVNCSQFGGVLFWLNDDQQKRVNEFETETGNLVYHVIETHYVELGRMLTLLYVSPYMEDWERDAAIFYDEEELKAGEPLAYVVNCDDEICSEYGCVGIQSCAGGLRRIW